MQHLIPQRRACLGCRFRCGKCGDARYAMRDRGLTEVYLNTGPELAAAVQLYERLGFVREEEPRRGDQLETAA
jgi:hypothetical protein